ncbi:ABC transporter permease [Bacillaceae bacterium SIJ1]|uniref:ABC transporter permease n=1 Tax=Litoribacterium kuwaitense TaxID=1398745 RepID=UPI0013ED2A01|nr:ABC transporter permease [Litoribacterium kuwaitense]NGP44840.1 ABC transporter permease [Litoribacterium kuwaitense]
MNNIHDLWKSRLKGTVRELARYGKYIFNDHFKFALLFAIGGGAYVYQQWLQALPPEFPTVFVCAIVMAFVLSYSPVYTFLKSADIVFMLPLEKQMGSYFFKSGGVSFTLQAYVLIIALAALAPLYLATEGDGQMLLLAIGAAVLTKIWNLASEWELSYYVDWRIRAGEKLVRFTLNVVFMFFIFSGSYWFAIVIVLLMLLLYLYMKSSRKQRSLKWDLLIEQEQGRMKLFYRIANLFTDVPSVQDRARRRKYMDWVVKRIPFQQTATYRYLYWRTFLRTGEYFGITLRLMVVGALLIWWLPYAVAKIAVAILFIYFIGFQLSTLSRHHREKIWLSIYPVSEDVKARALGSVIETLLMTAAICMPLPLIFTNWLIAVGSMGIGLLFALAYVRLYLAKRIQQAVRT